MNTIVENLKNISTEIKPSRGRQNPFELSVAETSADQEIAALEREKLSLAAQILNHPELHHLIDQGKITYAMIRPDLTLGTAQGTDQEIFEQIQNRIQTAGFDTILELPVHFGVEDVAEFYQEVKPKLETFSLEPGEGLPGTTTVWESFSGVMERRSVTVLLLYKEDATNTEGNTAWEQWRSLLGPTLPKPGESGNIRADFGNRTNNIGHGSDSCESVHRETYWLAQKLSQIPS